MKRAGIIVAFLNVVLAVQGQPQDWPVRPWVRFVLVVIGHPRYKDNDEVRKHAEAFFSGLMESGEVHETEGLAFHPRCRDNLYAILLIFLKDQMELADSTGRFNKTLAARVQSFHADGSLKRALYVPHDCRRLFRYLSQDTLAMPEPHAFLLEERDMYPRKWLDVTNALLSKPPLCRDVAATRAVTAYTQALLHSKEGTEEEALTVEDQPRQTLVDAFKYIFQSDSQCAAWGYAKDFTKFINDKLQSGEFLADLQDEETRRELLLRIVRGMPPSPSPSSPNLSTSLRTGLIVVLLTCSSVAASWTTR